MKTIVLTGMMGSGKSSVGKELAKKISVPFLDLDEVIEKETNLTINDIFLLHGEKYFRELEFTYLKKIFLQENCVISLGGGTFEDKANREFLLNNSMVFYLETSVFQLQERLKNDSTRPLLKNNDYLQTIIELFNKRNKNYKLAHFSIFTDNKSIDMIISEILRCVS